MVSYNNIELFHLKPDLLLEEVAALCKKGIENKVAAIVVPPPMVKTVKAQIKDQEIEVATVIGFPYGYQAVEAKIAEILLAFVDGVDTVEVVIHTLALKNKDWQYLANELNYILPVIQSKNKKITIILETELLTETEITQCCDLYGMAGVDRICTGTGITEKTTDAATVRLMRKQLANAVQIKAICFPGVGVTPETLLEAGASILSMPN